MSFEPDHGATSRAWSWRHAVAKSGLQPITRLVLHTLGLKMDATGGSCYPPISELVELTGLDKKTVLKHLELAEEAGWIAVSQHGFRGQKWKRNEYIARWPGRDLVGSPAAGDDEGGGALPPPSQARQSGKGGGAVPPPSASKVVEMTPEGGGNDAPKVVEQLHQDKILPANSPENSPSAGADADAQREENSGFDRKKVSAAFDRWQKGYPAAGSLEYAKNAWFGLSAEERAECIRLTPAFVASHRKSDLSVPAVYLKNREWQSMPPEADPAEKPAVGIAKAFGKLWMGTRLVTLDQPPTGLIHLTAFDERRIASGAVRREDVLREKRREHGWPLVREMADLARRRENFVTSLAMLPQVSAFAAVHRDSDLFRAWADLHARHDWPFFDHAPEWVYFPPVSDEADDLDTAVEDALATFLISVNEGRGNDDAA